MYVIQSVSKLNRILKEELHNAERPISYLAFQNAEINRDKKRRRQPFKPSDFYYYADDELLNLPEPKFGAAAMELIKHEQFPSWALFVYPELKKRADNATPPEVLCYQCEDAMILAPDLTGNSVQGMLLARNTASTQRRTMHSPCGRSIVVVMPEILEKVEATEGVELRVIQSIQ